MNENTGESAGWAAEVKLAAKNLPPAYFAMVMATGIVSIAALMLGLRSLAIVLFAVKDPLDWGAVFPLGMYAAATWQMAHAMDFGFLQPLAQCFVCLCDPGLDGGIHRSDNHDGA